MIYNVQYAQAGYTEVEYHLKLVSHLVSIISAETKTALGVVTSFDNRYACISVCLSVCLSVSLYEPINQSINQST